MAPATMINVLLTSFPGLNLPSTLALPVPSTTSVAGLEDILAERIPAFNDRLVLTTISNKQLALHSHQRISSYLASDEDAFLSLRLSARLCGGKGGFGSQLRAAGGRMSSKRKKNQGENNGSNRNLDGRRIRTVNEAKALAEYLEIKPDMEKKEKDQRRARWEQVVELAEKRGEEVKNGSKDKIDGKWVEDKEEAGERTREAVLAAMSSGDYKDNSLSAGSASSASNRSSDESSEDEDVPMSGTASKDTTPPSDLEPSRQSQARTFFGFDEDDEFMSDEEDEDDGAEEANSSASKGKETQKVTPESLQKGKGKAKASS